MQSPGSIFRGAAIGLLVGGVFAPPILARDDQRVVAIQAGGEIPEERLLDVGILVFDPGLPAQSEENLDPEELEAKGIFEGVRKAEARYIPIQLRQTLESTGNWGAVRVIPVGNRVDVTVSGRILESTGKRLKVQLRVVDARGRIWLNKKYKGEAAVIAYHKKKDADRREPFQSLYNRIANDMLKVRRKKLDDEYMQSVRTVSRLEFARDLAPAVFADYLSIDKKGRYSVDKLPAEGDPMMERIAQIRDRDGMFVDTLNEYYDDLYTKMEDPYDSWRSFSYDEQGELDKVRKKAKWAKILGVAAVVGGAAAAVKGGSGASVLGQLGIIAGIAEIRHGMSQGGDIKMHMESLRELGTSLDADVSPMVIEVEGDVTKLTGSVDTKYAAWRQLLREIFTTESGIPLDPNTTKASVTESPR